MKNKAAQSLAKRKLTPEELSAAMSAAARKRWEKIVPGEYTQPARNPTGIGGRPRIYPPCPRYKRHRFSVHADGVDRCPCGYERN